MITKKRIAVVLTVIASLLAAAPASAAVRSGSETFNPNSSAPSFSPPPQIPLLTIAISYDDAGTVTLTESGGNVPADLTSFESAGLPWTDFQWEFGGVSLFSSASPEIDISQTGGTLTDDQIAGALQPQVTPSSDGTSVTAVWSSSFLANLNLTYVAISGDTITCDSAGCYGYTGGAFYFSGYAPVVVIATPGVQTSLLGFAASPLQVRAQIMGVASSDQNAGITSITATGLPPGLVINSVGHISGTPTQPGNYTTTVTATGQYNGGTENTSATTTFGWKITRPVARLPVFLGAPYAGQGLQIKPRLITYTGDGTGFFAGFGKAGHRPKIGRLRWSEWTPTVGLSTGGDWFDNCTPACANGLRTAYQVRLKAYRPEVMHGYNVFTRLAVRYTHRLPPYGGKRSYVLLLGYDHGFGWK